MKILWLCMMWLMLLRLGGQSINWESPLVTLSKDCRVNEKQLTLSNGCTVKFGSDELRKSKAFCMVISGTGKFRCSGMLDEDVPFELQADGNMMTLNTPGGAVRAPVYNWNLRDWRLVHIQIGKDRKPELYLDGIAALTGPPTAEKPVVGDFQLAASGRINIREMIFDQETTPTEDQGKRFRSMVLKVHLIENPFMVIPEFTPPAGADLLNPESWRDAAMVSDFIIHGNGLKIPQQARVWVGADAGKFYLLYCTQLVAPLIGSKRDRDILSGGDEIEFFFAPVYNEEFAYFQFIGNPWESIYDACRGDSGWNGDWTYRCRVDGENWNAVIILNDFKELNAPTPLPGACWKLNFCRNWRAGQGIFPATEFSNTVRPYANINKFANVIFGGNTLPFVRSNSICMVDRQKSTVSAEFELVNPTSANVELQVKYEYFKSGDYRPDGVVSRKVDIPAKSRKSISLDLPLNGELAGAVGLSVQKTDDNSLIYKQSLKFDERNHAK